MSPHPIYSRTASTVCEEVNRSGLHMSSLPVVSQSNDMIHTTMKSVSCGPEEQPQHGFNRMTLKSWW